MALVRLQKYLAECGVGSRRKMEVLIQKGKVRVNGRVVKELGTKVDAGHDRVEVNGQFVQQAPKGIMLLNKPRGMISTLDDPEGRPTVAEYLTKHYQSYFPVGRLDWDSTGLLILTNDGELADRLMHPRYGIERIYEAKVEGSFPSSVIPKAARGVTLLDGPASAEISIIKGDAKSTWVTVKVKEGRNRLVRRLFERLGYPVMKLKRVNYGPIKLGALQVGEVRVLTQKEYETLRRKIFNGKDDKRGPKPLTRTALRKKAKRGSRNRIFDRSDRSE